MNGQTLPGAWNVELDIPVIGQATPQGAGLVRVWGISLAEIAQANDLIGKNIAIYAGMQKGLPLANPAQSGLIAQGYVFQAFGNWIGTDQTLDLVVQPGTASGTTPGGVGTLDAPKNIVLNWKAGTTLAAALQTTLQTAFPNYKRNISINAKLVRPNDEVGFYPTLELLAQYVLETSQNIIRKPNYPGVAIVLHQDVITVSDDVSSVVTTKSTQIAFTDLIGQPTWIESPNISIKTVMRADLAVGGKIKLPPTITTNSNAALSSLVNQRTSFQGGFKIVNERHVGNFRAPQADAWVTVIEAAPNVVSS